MPEHAGSQTSHPSVQKLPARLYAVMAMTTLVTFGTLTMGYQPFFTAQTFA